jgi:hypothetical protein
MIHDFDTDVRYTFGYPSITFIKDRVLVTYWAARDWPLVRQFEAQVRPG